MSQQITVAELLAHKNKGGNESDKLEKKFLERWNLLGGPPLEREYVALPQRNWRFDFAHIPSRTLFETHGATFVGGRHTTGSGFQKDREKINEAQLAGWRVFEMTSTAIKADFIERLIADVMTRGGAR